MKNTFLVTLSHGAVAQKETERTIFVEAESKQEAYNEAKKQLMDCGNDGFEYVVSIDEAKYNKSEVAEMKVKVKVYDGSKYKAGSQTVAEAEYEVEGFEVVIGERATEIGLTTDENSRDEFNEYLVLDLGNGETATFCNSHVDLFKL